MTVTKLKFEYDVRLIIFYSKQEYNLYSKREYMCLNLIILAVYFFIIYFRFYADFVLIFYSVLKVLFGHINNLRCVKIK